MSSSSSSVYSQQSSSSSSNSFSSEKIKELMELQMQRDFLEQHAKCMGKETSRALPSILDASLELGDRTSEENYQRHKSFLEEQIEAYRSYIETSSYNKFYKQGVLLNKTGSEEAGISRNLGQHFAQLQDSPDKAEPFVELSFNGGLCFYWKSPEQAAQFQNVLAAHQISAIATTEHLPGHEGQHLEYKTEQTTVVKVPHRCIELLLALAQYHPYCYEKVITDLYQNKIDRTDAILKEAHEVVADTTGTQESSVAVAQLDRLSLNEETDLIAIEIESREPTMVEKRTPHLVLVLDDSGSMDGQKIDALNNALRELINSLDDNILLSIQPLNRPTMAHRMPAGQLKKDDIKIKVIGSTPLLEAIASSAAHFREHPLDLVIPQAEFNSTTMVILTDGQPNGGPADTVDKLITGLRESKGLSDLKALKVRESFQAINVSFGSEAVPCTQLPVVLGFSIGTDGDTQFMQDLATKFSTPQGFIRTELEHIGPDMEQAVRLVQRMQGRHEKAFVGISYLDADGQPKAGGQQLRNLFYGYKRRVFFTVPKNSVVTAALIHEANVTAGLSCASFPTQNAALITEYVRNEFEELKAGYAKEALPLRGVVARPDFDEAQVILMLGIETKTETVEKKIQGRSGLITTVEERQVIKEQADYGNDETAWAEQKAKLLQLEEIENKAIEDFKKENAKTPLQKLKDETISRVDALIAYFPNDGPLKAEMELYRNTELSEEDSQQYARSGHLSVTSPSARLAVANFSQQRYIGTPMEGNAVVLSPNLGPVLDAIGKADMNALKDALAETPALINAVGEVAGSPLHAVLYRMTQKGDGQLQALTEMAHFLINEPNINLCLQNVGGSTTAHNAAWWGFSDILLEIIEKAKERGQLDALLHVRNHQQVGGTTLGESLMDNVRLSQSLQDSQKQDLLKALTLNTAACNGHADPDWNTPLMGMLGELRGSKGLVREEKRKAILEYIEANKADLRFQEASFHGNTALHFAFWNQEYTIGLAILKAAKAQGTNALQDVLAARNIVGVGPSGGGEVPHMNLVAKMHLLQKEETLAAVFEVFNLFEPFKIQFDTGDGQKRSIQEILNQGDPIGGCIQILKLMLEEDKYLVLSAEIQKWIAQLEALQCFMEVQAFIAMHLNDKGKAELGHLYTVYQKQIEGYCALNFLIQTPLQQLKSDYEALKEMGLEKELLDLLLKIIQKMTPSDMQAACKLITDWQAANPIDPKKPQNSDSPLHNRLTLLLIHLSFALEHQKIAYKPSLPLSSSSGSTSSSFFSHPASGPSVASSSSSSSSSDKRGLQEENRDAIVNFFQQKMGMSVGVVLGKDDGGNNNYYVSLAPVSLAPASENSGIVRRSLFQKSKQSVDSNMDQVSQRLKDDFGVGSKSTGKAKYVCPSTEYCKAPHIILTDEDVVVLQESLLQSKGLTSKQ